jgi:hypothetical protein
LAIVEMPAAFSGVLESDRNGPIDTALQAQHGQAMTDLRDLEQAIEIAESAVETGRDEVRQQTGADQKTFDKQAAPFENHTETPWLKRMAENGQEVVRVGRWAKDGSMGTGALPTPKDLETGKFFNDRAEYDAANHEWLKPSRRNSIGETTSRCSARWALVSMAVSWTTSSPPLSAASRLWKSGAFRSCEITFAPQALPSWRSDDLCASLRFTAGSAQRRRVARCCPAPWSLGAAG